MTTVLFLECKSYVIVGIYTSISEFPLMCGDVWWCAVFRHSRMKCYIQCNSSSAVAEMDVLHKSNNEKDQVGRFSWGHYPSWKWPKFSVSLKVPPTHRPYHRPTWSVMRSVSDGGWVGVVEGALLQGRLGKVFRIGTVRYHWPMSAHASQAFSIARCTDSEDLPRLALDG